MSYFEDLSEREDEILQQGYEGWKFSVTIFQKPIHLFPLNTDNSIVLKKNRDIPALVKDIKENLKGFVKAASKKIDANWLDLNNDLVRKELIWDINGYMYTLKNEGYFEDFEVVCDGRNNPPDLFENGGLRAEVLVLLDQEHKSVVFDLTAIKGE